MSIPTNIEVLLNEINKINENNLMDKIISYCDKYDYQIQEVGDILSESEQFKRRLWLDCVNNNTIKDDFLKMKQNETLDLDEW